MLVISSAIVLSPADAALPPGTPRILWDNIVTFGTIAADSEAAGYPATNLANPATNQEWRAEAAGDVKIAITVGVVADQSAVGIARHNFGSAGIAVSLRGTAGGVDAFTKLLLHFDGADASTTFTDSSGAAHVVTASGNAQIDTADFKFDGSAGLFDGVGDYVSTPDHADFDLGSGDFTIDTWFKIPSADAGGSQLLLAGQMDNVASIASTSFYIERRLSGNAIRAVFGIGAGNVTVQSLAGYTGSTNPGWHHLAVSRSGTSLRMFIDGVLQNTTSMVGTVNNSSSALAIGRGGEVASSEWKGWIDEFRLSVGIARWTAAFTPPVVPYPYELLVGEFMPANDEPLLCQFTEQSLSEIVIKLAEGDEAARAAVVYAGPMLIMPRGVDVDADFLIPRFARKTEYAAPLSERGDYVGRIVTSEYIEGVTHNYSHLEADFIRDEIDPFIASVQADAPFFYAMRADDGVNYDVAFAWFTDDPMPAKSPVTGRYKLAMKMGGIVE